MIGIHINSASFNYHDQHENITRVLGAYSFTISFHGVYSKEVFFENNEYMVFVDGWIFNADNYETQAQWLLNKYLELGDDFIYQVNGQFNIAIIDKNTADFKFFNDIFSLRKHFFSLFDESIVISSDLEFINSVIPNKTLNKEHIKKSIALPRFIDIRNTFLQEVKQILPCAKLFNNSVDSYPVQNVEKNFSNKAKTQEEFLECLKENISEVVRDESILLLLSGGLDSRFVLELLNELRINFKTATYGTTSSDEVNIARSVAESNNSEHIIHHTEAVDFVINAQKYINQTAGMDIFPQCAVYEFYKSIQEKNIGADLIIDTGFALDVYLGGTYVSKKERLDNDNILGKNNPKIIDPYEYSEKNRVFSALSLRQSAHREFYEDRYCMFNYKTYFMMKSLPVEAIIDHKYYFKLAKLQIKNSHDIPLQSTMFNLNLDVKYWKEAEKIQQQKEELSLEYYRETGKVVYHNRYYSDFDMWMRSDKDWINLIKSMFIERESILSRLFVDNQLIQQYISEHLSGEKSHRRNIIKWISLEMFFLSQEGENTYSRGNLDG
jgi:hypothetical protein